MLKATQPVGSSFAILLAGLLSLAISACGGRQAVDHVRFKNAPPVAAVNDRLHVEQPEENKFYRSLYHFDGYIHDRLSRTMALRDTGRSRNVNSLGEVPNSTWFTNRIGVRDLTPEEVGRGPNVGDGPEMAKPWTIKSSKVGGVSPGFIIKDAKGDRYLLKFDRKGFPEIETAVDVILARLLWACGYNVPEDRVVYFSRSDLVLDADASVKDVFGNKTPLTEKVLDKELERIEMEKDGRIRGLVSKFLPGKPLGGATRDWPREDDPNNRINHFERRDLRGQYAFFSWLDHADIKEDNTLDVYVEDPKNPKTKYVKHFLLDFGNALGAQATINARKSVGFASQFQFSHIGASLFSLGIYRRQWEDRYYPHIHGVGYFEWQAFDPGAWHGYSPSYYPVTDSDRFDNFWASKILVRFNQDHLKAAVKEARYSDPEADAYVVRALTERQRMVARYWFERVNPLDNFVVTGSGANHKVCFDDLLIKYKVGEAAGRTTYTVAAHDYDGKVTGFKTKVAATISGQACFDGLAPATGASSSSRSNYTIVRLDTDRKFDRFEREDEKPLPGTLVHLATDPQTGNLRVIGIRRL